MMPHLSVSRLFASSVPEAGFSLDTGDQGAVGTIGDAPRPRERALASLDPNADLADAFGTLTFKNELFRDAVVHQGTFTNTDGATRGFLVANATGAMDMGWLDAICKVFQSLKLPIHTNCNRKFLPAKASTPCRCSHVDLLAFPLPTLVTVQLPCVE